MVYLKKVIKVVHVLERANMLLACMRYAQLNVPLRLGGESVHLWMHSGGQIKLTQLGFTSSPPACVCVCGYQLCPPCWSSKPLSHPAYIISPQSYWEHQTEAHVRSNISARTSLRIITSSHRHQLMTYYDRPQWLLLGGSISDPSGASSPTKKSFNSLVLFW